MQITSNTVNGPKSNNEILLGIWIIVCIQKTFCRPFVHFACLSWPFVHHFLLTFRPLRMFMILFRDSSLYRKQLPLFSLLWLISANADRTDYFTNFCSMVELLHELKNSSC